jgi:hypothetical protein
MCWAKAESSTSLWAGGATTQPGPEPSIGYAAGMLAPTSAHLRMRAHHPAAVVERSDSCPGSIRRIARRLHLTSDETLGCLGVPGFS